MKVAGHEFISELSRITFFFIVIKVKVRVGFMGSMWCRGKKKGGKRNNKKKKKEGGGGGVKIKKIERWGVYGPGGLGYI